MSRFEIRPGEAYGLVGESGCGKTTVAMAVMRYLPRQRARRGRRDSLSGAGSADRGRSGAAGVARQPDGDGLSGSRAARSTRRLPSAGRSPRSTGSIAAWTARRRAMPRRRMLETRADLRSGARAAALSARALRRPAAADHVRHGAGDRPRSAGAGRTDHRARRDGGGRGARPGRRSCATEFDTAILFISHNLGIVARMCERVGVLYAGRLIEEGPARELFADPRHPYTLGLLRCVPRAGHAKGQPPARPDRRARCRRSGCEIDGLRLCRALPDRRGRAAAQEAPPACRVRRTPIQPLLLSTTRCRTFRAGAEASPAVVGTPTAAIALLEIDHLRKTYGARGYRGDGRRRRVDRARGRRGAGAGRRIRQRQIHPREMHCRPGRRTDGGIIRFDGADLRAGRLAEARRLAAQAADGVPEPRHGAQPAATRSGTSCAAPPSCSRGDAVRSGEIERRVAPRRVGAPASRSIWT